MDSAFDPANLLERTWSGQLATHRQPIPPDEYPATVADIKAGTANVKNKETGIEEVVPTLDVTFEIQDPELQKTMGLNKLPTASRKIWLNLDENDQLDPDNNIALGQLVEACGVDMEGEWTLADLIGASVVIRITTRPDQSNPQHPGYTNVAGYVAD